MAKLNHGLNIFCKFLNFILFGINIMIINYIYIISIGIIYLDFIIYVKILM
jgi:hypothetical protein